MMKFFSWVVLRATFATKSYLTYRPGILCFDCFSAGYRMHGVCLGISQISCWLSIITVVCECGYFYTKLICVDLGARRF